MERNLTRAKRRKRSSRRTLSFAHYFRTTLADVNIRFSHHRFSGGLQEAGGGVLEAIGFRS